MSEGTQAQETRQPDAPARERRRILLAEDDDLVRWVLVTCLRDSGFDVVEARNGVEALSLSEAAADAFDLLVTDRLMPQMNGYELARKLYAAHPNLRVLFVSGSAEEPEATIGLRADRVFFLPKPFTTEALAQRVREMLP